MLSNCMSNGTLQFFDVLRSPSSFGRTDSISNVRTRSPCSCLPHESTTFVIDCDSHGLQVAIIGIACAGCDRTEDDPLERERDDDDEKEKSGTATGKKEKEKGKGKSKGKHKGKSKAKASP